MNIFGKPSALKSSNVSADRKKELRLFEKYAKVRFRNHDVLNLAFSHRSYSNENPDTKDNNERLEFLGDSVLGIVVSTYLFQVLPDRSEGDLAKIKSFVVSEDILSAIAKGLSVDRFLLIGKGEECSGGREKKAILADAMEAIIGAFYLDSGFAEAQQFVLDLMVPEINKVLEDRHKKDYKTLLQEFVQKTYKSYPKYILVKKSGPDHDKTFFMEVQINGETCGSGEGKNKKEAEQNAASEAFGALTQGRSAISKSSV